ncbi:peptidoglycan bridge formation glycyltransferase FemA/FemB family protein [Paenibacillus larvae]|nr:peptidoglycan bridge formation glycyltransferase FemA/FemB family protein [Paenibacillus larvae]MDT2254899.1 peptidoglycan bridge formation glycyltransferase FemA/FemB family protein [Paenibacillus larvae]
MEQMAKEHPDGLVVSGAIEAFAEKSSWYVYGASDNVFRDYMPNYLIQWEMMKEAKKEDVRCMTLAAYPGISHLIILFGVFISSKRLWRTISGVYRRIQLEKTVFRRAVKKIKIKERAWVMTKLLIYVCHRRKGIFKQFYTKNITTPDISPITTAAQGST